MATQKLKQTLKLAPATATPTTATAPMDVTQNQEEFFQDSHPATLTPPVEGATMKVSAGKNAGCRYWSLLQKNQWGRTESVYFEWIDVPKTDLGFKLDTVLERLQEIKSLLHASS